MAEAFFIFCRLLKSEMSSSNILQLRITLILKGAAKTFKINYFSVSTNSEFRKIYKDALKSALEKGNFIHYRSFYGQGKQFKIKKRNKRKNYKSF